jgi:predicted acyltransferase
MNAITIYFLSSLISKSMYLTKVATDSNLHDYLYEVIFVHSFFSDPFSSLLYGLSVTLFYIGFAYLLFKSKILIKVWVAE